MRKFYLYAGYYELFISNRPLRRPYSFISWHKSLDAVQRAAEKFDPDAHVHYAEQIAPPETDEWIDEGYARRDLVDGIPFVIC